MEIDATFFSASKVVVSFEIQILEADLSLPLKDTLTALREFLAFLIPTSSQDLRTVDPQFLKHFDSLGCFQLGEKIFKFTLASAANTLNLRCKL
jgi:hypothetical protein